MSPLRSSSPPPDETTLLHLPELVVYNLISYVPLATLLSLRLTCTTTKKWVERPKHIKKLQLVLGTEKDFNSLISMRKRSPPWSNFRFLPDKRFPRPKALIKFLSTFANSISVLDFSSPEDTAARNETIVDILLGCENLQSLKVCELTCSRIAATENGLRTLINNWKGLKYLSIQHMLCPEYQGLGYFSRLLLEGCSNSLVELNPPTIALTSPDYLSFNYKFYFKRAVVVPIIEVLPKRKLKTVHVQEHLFDGDPSLLFQLAQVCLEEGAVLHPETFLPFSRSIFMSVPPNQASLFQALGRISGIDDSILAIALSKPLPHLQFLSISFRSFFLSDYALSAAPSPLPLLLPNLIEVEIEMTNDPPWEDRPHKLSAFMRALCSTPRPSVKKLVLAEVTRANDNPSVRAHDLVHGFPSLTHLVISNWDAGNAEFVMLWRGLPNLEDIQLRFCHQLGDEGMADMVSLKKLHTLTINDAGSISDATYINVLRHLPLRSFYHYCSGNCLITRKGYNALATPPFQISIRQLLLQNPNEFRTIYQFCAFLAQFPNLPKPQYDEAMRRCIGDSLPPLPPDEYQTHYRSCCTIL